jgi:hypothetical protein
MKDEYERGSPDDQFINVHDGDEVRHWCRMLHTDPTTLVDVVARVGESAEKVKRHLQRKNVQA